jgi:hypothetical protein
MAKDFCTDNPNRAGIVRQQCDHVFYQLAANNTKQFTHAMYGTTHQEQPTGVQTSGQQHTSNSDEAYRPPHSLKGHPRHPISVLLQILLGRKPGMLPFCMNCCTLVLYVHTAYAATPLQSIG